VYFWFSSKNSWASGKEVRKGLFRAWGHSRESIPLPIWGFFKKRKSSFKKTSGFCDLTFWWSLSSGSKGNSRSAYCLVCERGLKKEWGFVSCDCRIKTGQRVWPFNGEKIFSKFSGNGFYRCIGDGKRHWWGRPQIRLKSKGENARCFRKWPCRYLSRWA